MKLRLIQISFALALAVHGLAQADDTNSQSGPLGKVGFPTSCDPKVQPLFERGVAMLHSFWYSAAEKTFRDVLAQDPSCAIANWGIAAILMSNPLAGQGASPKGAAAAQAAIDQGRRVGAQDPARARLHRGRRRVLRGFLDPPERARQESRAKAFEALAARYPDDDEAQIFCALYIAGTQSQADQTYAAYLKAAAILEKQFVKYPDHPGVAHYLIHSYDAPPIAQQGPARRAPLCEHRAGGAARAAHAFAHLHPRRRVGRLGRDQRRSAEVARRGGDDPTRRITPATTWCTPICSWRATTTPGTPWKKRSRSAGFNPAQASRMRLPRCLRATRWSAARGARRCSCSPRRANSRLPTPSRISRERSARRAAATSPPPRKGCRGACTHCTRPCRTRRTTIGRPKSKSSGSPSRDGSRLPKARPDDALKFMRAAADLEDSNEKHIVTPGRIVPARELLGEMLLELKQPALALKEFEASQRARTQPLPRLLRRGARGGSGRRSRESRRVLPEARGAGEKRRHRAARAREREEARFPVSRLARLVVAGLLCAAIAAFPSIASADPVDERSRSRHAGTRTTPRADGRSTRRIGRRPCAFSSVPRCATPTARTCRTSSAIPTAT